MKFTEEAFAPHMRPITGSAIREIFKLLGKPGMISFAGGNPSNAALEPEVISELAVEVLAKYGTTLLQYGATEGFAPFVESAGEFLSEVGLRAGAGELLPVQGGTQGFDLLIKALVEPGDVILAEDPTFLGALQAMHTYNARIIPVATDENGVIPEDVEEKIKKYSPKLMYIIPSFQNPTGVTLSLERRKAMAHLACEYGVVLAEDDPYRDLRYAGEALPAIKAFDAVSYTHLDVYKRQQLPLFAEQPAAPHRADGVDDVLAGQAEALRHLGFAGPAAAQRRAGCLHLRPRGAVDGPVQTPVAAQGVVRGVDDGVHGHFGDVIANDLQWHGVPLLYHYTKTGKRAPAGRSSGRSSPSRVVFRPYTVRTARPAPCRHGSPRPRGPWCQRRSRCWDGRCPSPARCACTPGCAASKPV